MKPAICVICGKGATDISEPNEGDWVMFSNYHYDDAIISLDDPDGLEYFCDDHIAAAMRVRDQTSDIAIAKLKDEFKGVKPYERELQPVSWWRRLFS